MEVSVKTFLKYFLIFGLCTLSCSAITPEEQQKQLTQLLDVINKQQKTLEKMNKAPKSSLLSKSLQAVAAVTSIAGLGYLAFTQHKLVDHIAGLNHQISGIEESLAGLNRRTDNFVEASTCIQIINIGLSIFGLTSALSASDGVHRLLSLVRNR